MNLQNRFLSFVHDNQLFTKSDLLLVACSGGVDSVVLCDLLYANGFSFQIAHCNFQLRGDESIRDENFVQSLAVKYGVGLHIKRFDTQRYSIDNKLSIQVAARTLRYEWFGTLLDEMVHNDSEKPNNKNDKTSFLGRSWLLTAHHADDSVETMLMNIFKGTGLSGCHGILPKQKNIVRPLLFAQKEEIVEYAKDKQLSWVEDSSNESDKYTRNFFRHQIIPQIKQVIPSADKNILTTISHLRDAEMVYSQVMSAHQKKLLQRNGNEVHIPVLMLQKLAPTKTIFYEILKEFGFSTHQMKDAMSLLEASTGKYIQSATHKLIKNRNWLIISPQGSQDSTVLLVDDDTTSLQFELGELQIFQESYNHQKPIFDSLHEVELDSKNIQFPLVVRKWKAGDYFYPLGMQKKKKVARFLIDKKVSISDKEKVWVVESCGKILWVIGYRIDNRFKITNQTTNSLRLKLTPIQDGGAI